MSDPGSRVAPDDPNLVAAAEMCSEQPPCAVCRAIAGSRWGAHSEWLREQQAEAWAEGVRAMTEAHGHSCHVPWPAPVSPYRKTAEERP